MRDPARRPAAGSPPSKANRGYASRVDHEVAKTLAELELKLRELERELMSIGRRATEPADTGPPPMRHPPEPTAFQRVTPPTQPQPPSRLVDEAVEAAPPQRHRYSLDTQETAFGEIPATKDERDTIELGELVRFKEEMQSTLQGLIDEYSRLLSLKPRSGA